MFFFGKTTLQTHHTKQTGHLVWRFLNGSMFEQPTQQQLPQVHGQTTSNEWLFWACRHDGNQNQPPKPPLWSSRAFFINCLLLHFDIHLFPYTARGVNLSSWLHNLQLACFWKVTYCTLHQRQVNFTVRYTGQRKWVLGRLWERQYTKDAAEDKMSHEDIIVVQCRKSVFIWYTYLQYLHLIGT